jgi:hypothetical protein
MYVQCGKWRIRRFLNRFNLTQHKEWAPELTELWKGTGFTRLGLSIGKRSIGMRSRKKSLLLPAVLISRLSFPKTKTDQESPSQVFMPSSRSACLTISGAGLLLEFQMVGTCWTAHFLGYQQCYTAVAVQGPILGTAGCP